MIVLAEERAALAVTVERGEHGDARILHRVDWPAAPVVEALRDPDAFVSSRARKRKRSKKKERRRNLRKRLVGWKLIDVDGEPTRLFVKIYRLRTAKDWVEEFVAGNRAKRALDNGLEAERRGIRVPPHLGAVSIHRSRIALRLPGESALAMIGLPTRRDARETLILDHPRPGSKRARFLREIAAFCADLHRRGLAHGDLKAGNIIVVQRDPPTFALLDLDRTSFRLENRRGLDLRDAVDLYRLLQSLRKCTTPRERRVILATYRRARGLPRYSRWSVLLTIAARFARGR